MRNPTSRVILSCATMKVQVALLLCVGLALQLCLPMGADASRVHPAQFLERSGRPSARQHRSRAAVTVPGSLDETTYSYRTQFRIGSPPRKFEGIADTGSRIVWVQCSDCTQCLPDEPNFQPNRSSTFETIPCSQSLCSDLTSSGMQTNSNCSAAMDLQTCEYVSGYDEGYSFGHLSSDVLTLASENGKDVTFPNFVFGCAFNSGGGVDPILALSRSSFSLVGQLEPEEGKAFSFCFPAYGENKTTQLTLGSGSKGMQTKDLKYTPLIAPSVVQSYQYVPSITDREDLYYANVNGISIDGENLQIPKDAFSLKQGGMFLDTGSSLTSLADNIYNPLVAVLNKKITYRLMQDSDSDPCYDITSENATSVDELILPSITFHFQDLDLQLPTANAFVIDSDNGTTEVCLAMLSNGPAGSGNIFGNFQMQNSYYLFDLENNRVGIRPENC